MPPLPSSFTPNSIQPVDVRFQNITYEVPLPKQYFASQSTSTSPSQSQPTSPLSLPHPILVNISGYVPAGQSLAILGPSGSGKTTLLNLIAARSQYPAKTGQVLFGGRPRIPRTKRHIGYVMQDDVFFSKLTVRETLQFTANIRLPDSTTPAEKIRRVEDVMTRLRLTKCQNTRIGDQQFDKGISGGERKRVNIANELLHDPSVLLADECTSGLDSSSAFTVINQLRDLCREGRTVIASIHQPSSQMFLLFDQIMLLTAGRLAYLGPPAVVQTYFSSIDLPFPQAQYNPADYMLELVIDHRALPSSDPSSHHPAPNSTQAAVVSAWAAFGPARIAEHALALGLPTAPPPAPVITHVALDVDASGASTSATEQTRTESQSTSSGPLAASKPALSPIMTDPDPPGSFAGRLGRAGQKRFFDLTGQHVKNGNKYATSWYSQAWVLGKRAMQQKRGMLLQKIYIAQVFCVALISCLFWFRMEPVERTIEDRLGALSFFCVFWGFYSTFSALFAFPMEKQVLNKDRAGGSYRLSAYYFAKTMVETPADMIYPTVFSLVTYFTIRLNPHISSFILFLVVLILDVLTAQSIGLLISALVMDVRKAQVIGSIWILSSMLVSGYYIDPENTPDFVKPFRQLSFLKVSVYIYFFM